MWKFVSGPGGLCVGPGALAGRFVYRHPSGPRAPSFDPRATHLALRAPSSDPCAACHTCDATGPQLTSVCPSNLAVSGTLGIGRSVSAPTFCLGPRRSVPGLHHPQRRKVSHGFFRRLSRHILKLEIIPRMVSETCFALAEARGRFCGSRLLAEAVAEAPFVKRRESNPCVISFFYSLIL